MKILIIDDSEVIRNLLKDYLNDQNIEVDIAENGIEGIEKALNNDYTIIFCDTHMPKKNGYQVYKSVTEKKPYVKFIMTDSMPDTLSHKTLEEGAYYILNKPFNLNEVKTALNKILTETVKNDG